MTKGDKLSGQLLPLWRRLLWLSIFSVIALAALLSLGNWQVDRMHWKEALTAAVDARIDADPILAPDKSQWAKLEPDDYRYTRVAVRGTLLHQHQQYSYMVVSEPQGGPHRGQGYWVMTPLQLESSAIIWINRGFTPLENAAESFADSGSEQVEIVGLMRAPELPNFATPGNSNGLDNNIWFIRNIAAMSDVAGLSPKHVAPYFIDEQSLRNGALPQGGETRVQFSNRHLGYVITWYGLALALIGVYGVFAFREYKKGRETLPT